MRLPPQRWHGSLERESGVGLQTGQGMTSAGEITRPKWLLVTHMFNHQTHHRGQVHCMLTQAGGKPHDTDMPLMAE